MAETNAHKHPLYKDAILHWADNSLILAQRLCEWCGHGPVLEQDIALSNIALDLLGEASNYFEYAAELFGPGHTADSLAMLREERAYKNLLLVELPNGHFGDTVARQYFYDSMHVLMTERLMNTDDAQLAAIAEKTWKEARYHLRWSAEWMIRLGDGTEESHVRMQKAVDRILPYVGEFFVLSSYQEALIKEGLIPDPRLLEDTWKEQVREVLALATLDADLDSGFVQTGGKEGVHTEHLGYVLSDLQYMQRTYPGLDW